MSGSGGDLGYDYQADGYAYIAAHGLAGQPLTWFENSNDIPATVLMETGSPGDDLQIITVGGRRIELQAKHALKKRKELYAAVRRLVRGLSDDSELRGVIMVDRASSRTITEGLRLDLIRLGQGRDDDLKPITKDVLKNLRQKEISTAGVFARLRIVVVDLDEGSAGGALGCGLLGRIVEPSNAQAAWKLLGKRGHGLTKNRGRDELWGALAFLETEVGLRPESPSPFAGVVRFRHWMESITAEFFCPAIGKQFPIRQAWNTIQPLESDKDERTHGSHSSEALVTEIRRYHEWHRLADGRQSDQATEADHWLRSHHRAVIIGGPGAGKSTLSKRIAHYSTREGKLVVRVRLWQIAQLIRRGRTFDESLRAVALDKSGVPERDARALLSAPDMLIADGLDECGPKRIDVADALKAWADSHRNTAVVVFTRPVGHVPDLLPGFKHAELLPLDRDALRVRVEWFTQALIQDSAKAGAESAIFMIEVADKSQGSVASIASRNPLLLSFLVRLHLDGGSVHGQRARLFENIVELMRKTNPLDRPQEVGEVNWATAWRAAETLGWECLERPDSSVATLIESLTRQLGGNVVAASRAEAAIRFWEEHGLIERLTLGSLDAITFVHPALGEYAAARYLANADPDELVSHITRFRRQPQYRETILLAAGVGAGATIVDTLLNNDDPVDPASTEAILAAAALAEMEAESYDSSLAERVANHLRDRLQSPIPLVTIEAGAGLTVIAPLFPEIVGNLAASLCDHAQPWTQLAARAACLVAGSQFVDIATVLRWIEEFQPVVVMPSFTGRTTVMPSGAHDLQARTLAIGVRRLITELEPLKAKPVVMALLKKRNLSWKMAAALQSVLHSPPYSEWVMEADLFGARSRRRLAETMGRAFERLYKCDRFFLTCALQAAGSEGREATAPPEDYASVAKILAAMHVWECTLPDWGTMSEGLNPDIVAEVIRGTIIALGLNPDDVAREAHAFLETEGHQRALCSDHVPRMAIEVQWEQAKTSQLDVDKLTAALSHPCWSIAHTAAELLSGGVGGEDARQLILEVLKVGTGRALLLVGAIAKDIWGSDAFGILDERLSQPLTAGYGYLYKYLAECASADQTEAVIERGLQGLRADKADVAAQAAEMLRDQDAMLLQPRATELCEAMKLWAERGSWCDQCQRGVTAGSCDACHVLAPSPRAFLTDILVNLGMLSVDELIELTKDPWHGVPEAARKALAQKASTDRTVMVDVLQKIGSGGVGIEVLSEILTLPAETLQTNSSLVLELLESERTDVRSKIVGALSGPWLDRQEALQRARAALADPDPIVRNEATLALRILSS